MTPGRVIAAGALLLLAAAAFAGPRILSYQGTVLDASGQPVVDGTYDMRFSIWSEATTGTQRWSETDAVVAVRGGLFSTLLGDVVPIPVTTFTWDYEVWLEVAVDLDGSGTFEPAEVYSPRQRMASAAWAVDADRLQGHDSAYFQRRVTGAAPAGSFISGINPDGTIVTGSAVDSAAEAQSALGLQGRRVAATAPAVGDLLQWNGNAWEPATAAKPANQFPVAILQADPGDLNVSGDGQLATELSLALSRDPEGGVLSYAFDPTGRGVGAPTSFGSAATTTVAYSGHGDYLAAGWVRDSTGAFSRAQALVSVYEWSSTIPDSAGIVGQYASLAVVNGRPAIAYYDTTNGDLKYVRAHDADGAAWGTPVTPDSAGSAGQYASLAVVNGRPAIAYYNVTNSDLKYVRANDADGAAWGEPVTLDSPGSVGYYASLAIVNGRPAVAYFDNTNFDLKYVRANDADGAAWGAPVTPDSPGNVGHYASLAVVNGRPAIAYQDYINRDLKYVRANDADGAAWGAPVTADSLGDVGHYASLAVVNIRPAIAYRDNTSDDLKYVRGNDANGAAWGTPVTPDSAGNVGMHASLAVVNGRPAIAYLDSANADLKYVRANDADGAAWAAPVTPDRAGPVGYHASLAIVNGRPAIAHHDSSSADLRYTIPQK